MNTLTKMLKLKKSPQEAMQTRIASTQAELDEARQERDRLTVEFQAKEQEADELRALIRAGELAAQDAAGVRAKIEAAMLGLAEKRKVADDDVKSLETTVRVLVRRADEIALDEQRAAQEEADKRLRAAIKKVHAALAEASAANYEILAAAYQLHAAGGDPYARTVGLVVREIMFEQVDNNQRRIPGATTNSEFVRWLTKARALGYLPA
jgi:predicted  nucleic acid-binding Zn-ribbon protein